MRMRWGREDRKSQTGTLVALTVAVVVALGTQGCGQGSTTPPASAPAPPPKAATKLPARDAGKGTQKVVYRYDPANKPDPFRPFILLQKKAETAISPLQKYDLGQITLKAVVWGMDQPRAMVEDPTGKGYVIQIGTDIGKNSGKVIKIDDRQVLVRETYVDYTGRETTKDVALKILASDGEEG